MADAKSVLLPRFAVQQIRAALADTPVVAVNGARQVGKSTLVSQLVGTQGQLHVVTMDDRTQFEAARSDPHSFVDDRYGTLVIDEVQRVPDLLLAIKAAVDRDRRPGRFLLTGSTRLLSTPQLSESLAGRIEIVDLWPLSQGEVGRAGQERFVDALFSWDPALRAGADVSRQDYFERICCGGFPVAAAREGKRRRAWFDNYATTVLERMVAEVADIERLNAMPTLLRLCAARTANELNVTSVANDLGLPARTVSTYLAHLQTVFLVDLIPAWSRNVSSKVVHRPKLSVVDSGLAAYLLGVDAPGLGVVGAPLGQLLETFVVMEIRKQLGWSETAARLHHFRDRDGSEVDVVLEADGGRVAGVEVKAASTVTHKDFKGLRLLQSRLGERFAGGVVLYTGRDAVPFGNGLAAVPVASLWQTI